MESALATAGKIAGLAGISVCFALFVFRDIIAKNVFPRLRQDDAYKVIRLLIICTSAIALVGIVLWAAPTIVVGNYNMIAQ